MDEIETVVFEATWVVLPAGVGREVWLYEDGSYCYVLV